LRPAADQVDELRGRSDRDLLDDWFMAFTLHRKEIQSAELLEEATAQLVFGRFAAQHASAAVRNAATDQAELWSSLRGKLETIAGDLDVPTPQNLDRLHRAAFDAFVRLDGKAFDGLSSALLRGKIKRRSTIWLESIQP
jgi:hypothetical protein